MKTEIQMIEIERIRILNPRHREKKRFELIVESIKNLGLKKPIQVSLRSVKDGEEPGYDLVCGQGRIEAFQSLGYKEIPAEVVSISKEDRMLRSLVENLARRNPTAFDLIREIERLKSQGYSNVAIGKKLDISDVSVFNLLTLSQAGEERLLAEALRGSVPLWVAVEISKAKDLESQRELLKAYQKKEVNQASIKVINRLIEQRRFLGKRISPGGGHKKSGQSAESMVSAYRRECDRQKLLVKKARICESKLLVLVTAFKELVRDEDFINLLRAEGLATMPTFLSEMLSKIL